MLKAIRKWLTPKTAPAQVCLGCKIREAQCSDMELKFSMASGAQRVLQRRATALQKEYPEIFQRYFTKQGELERQN